MIIVEGADNCGKSTLIRQLLELDPSLRILHRDRFNPKREGDSIGVSYLKALLPPDGDRVRHARSVADRFWASEEIYGELFRGGSRLTPGERQAIRGLLASYGAQFVVCDPGDAAIKCSWDERPQLYDHDPLVIARAYRERIPEIFNRPGYIFPYDYSASSAKEVRDAITYFHGMRMRDMERLLTWLSAMPFGVGPADPLVMLVGESPSPRAIVPVPFAAGPAGDFLAWTIERASERVRHPGLPWEIYTTNADKGTERDAALLREEIAFTSPQVVVALGREAEEMVGSLDLTRPWAAIPHPQFWRRFHYKRRSEYVAKFVNAITLAPAFR